jgi:hypothetical protein
VNNTIACNDGNACTTNDACAGGACTGGPPLDCNDGNQCTTDGCIPAAGCAHTFVTGPCDDGNVCTAGEACASGTCGGGSPNDGIACSDGNACTVTDLCAGGSCLPGATLDCNDNNVCTNDSCNTVTGCGHTNNSVSCSDGLLCTTGDMCGGGACHGTPVICNDNNACTDDACNPSTGSCVSLNDDTNACSDGNLCTQVDACQAGACVGASPVSCGGACPPGTSQEPDGCQKVYDIGVNALDNLLAYCDGTGSDRYNNCSGPDYGFHWTDLGGGLPVTSLDVWFVSGIHCQGTTSSVKLNGTIVGSFNPQGTCTCSPPRSVISFADFPLGAYAPGAQNAIRITPAGCEGLSISAALGDNYARVTVTYAALDSCRVPTCVPSTGACSYPALPDGTACTDGSACTTGDLCSGGSCTPGSPLVCVDGDDCTTDSCDPAAGCIHTAVGPPSEVGGVTLAKTAGDVTIAWTLASSATSSDVLRGDIAALPVGPGGGDEVCLGSTGTTEMTDFDTLAPGSGAWYLVRGANACAGSGSYGLEGVHGAPGAPRATTTCP